MLKSVAARLHSLSALWKEIDPAYRHERILIFVLLVLHLTMTLREGRRSSPDHQVVVSLRVPGALRSAKSLRHQLAGALVFRYPPQPNASRFQCERMGKLR